MDNPIHPKNGNEMNKTPPLSALQMVQALMALKAPHDRSEAGLMNVKFFESL